MLHNQTYTASIFESLGMLSSFNAADAVWEQYEQFAVSKIEESTLKLRGAMYYLKDLSAKDAERELGVLALLIPALQKLKGEIEPIGDKRFQRFRAAALAFVATTDQLYDGLQDIADIQGAYKASIPVLAEDWDRQEDDHWDNY